MTSKGEHVDGKGEAEGGESIDGNGRGEKEMSRRDTPGRGGGGGSWYSTI